VVWLNRYRKRAMQNNLTDAMKYVWFTLSMRATGSLPDLIPVMRFRGFLVKCCFASCGPNLQIASNVTILHPTRISIGSSVYIAHGSWIQGVGRVILENEVMLGPYTVLASSNHTRINGSYRYGQGINKLIRMGHGSWTGAHSVITSGVTVGQGAACAAGCVVTKDVPANSVVGGIPAKILKGLG